MIETLANSSPKLLDGWVKDSLLSPHMLLVQTFMVIGTSKYSSMSLCTHLTFSWHARLDGSSWIRYWWIEVCLQPKLHQDVIYTPLDNYKYSLCTQLEEACGISEIQSNTPHLHHSTLVVHHVWKEVEEQEGRTGKRKGQAAKGVVSSSSIS